MFAEGKITEIPKVFVVIDGGEPVLKMVGVYPQLTAFYDSREILRYKVIKNENELIKFIESQYPGFEIY